MSLSDEEQTELTLNESLQKFTGSISRINTVAKLDSFMQKNQLEPGVLLKLKHSNDKIKFEHCVLLSGNSFVVRELVNRGGYDFFIQYNSYGLGYHSVFDSLNKTPEERAEIDASKRADPANFLINSYKRKSYGSFPIKNISPEFVLTMVDIFKNKLDIDAFFQIIADHCRENALEESIKNEIVDILRSGISNESIESLITNDSYRNVYFGKNSVDLIEKNIENFYGIQSKKNLGYILASPYNYGMLNILFEKNDSKEIFYSAFNHFCKNYKCNSLEKYENGSIAACLKLNHYYIDNNSIGKVKFLIDNIDEQKIDFLKDEYDFILREAISSGHDCKDVLTLFSKHYKDKEYNHFINLNAYFSGKNDKNTNNLKNYIEQFALNNFVLSHEQYDAIIHSIMNGKRTEIFRDFIDLPFFDKQYLSLISTHLGKSLARKRTSAKENEKEILFYLEVIKTLQKYNVKIGEDVESYLNKNTQIMSKLKSLVESRVLTENLADIEHKPVVKKRL